ncbi:MAG: FadR family transcriptional regulator [Clostridiales bacterium]|nr:FadR family transcriptional regulator [Clostridiales bacterium]
MEFEKLCAPTLKELFIEQLENMILSGKLSIGQKLPPERELAASMRVSRGVVNAGLAEMAEKGFLETVPRSGTYVTDYRRRGRLETLVSIMKFNGGSLPNADIRSILEIRLVLFKLAFELAIPRIEDFEIDEMFKCSEELDRVEEPAKAAELAFEFDHLLCCYSGNTLLPLIFYSFKSPNMTLFERYFRKHGYDSMRLRTRTLCKAMANRDLEAAIACLTSSIEETIDGKTTLYS